MRTWDWGWVRVRTEECERAGPRGAGRTQHWPLIWGCRRVPLRLGDVREQGLVAQGVRADRDCPPGFSRVPLGVGMCVVTS